MIFNLKLSLGGYKQIVIIPNSSLFVSEPDPYDFGNDKNEPNNPKWTNKNWLKSRFHFSFAGHIINNVNLSRIL